MPMPTGRELALIKALQCKCGIKNISGSFSCEGNSEISPSIDVSNLLLKGLHQTNLTNRFQTVTTKYIHTLQQDAGILINSNQSIHYADENVTLFQMGHFFTGQLTNYIKNLVCISFNDARIFKDGFTYDSLPIAQTADNTPEKIIEAGVINGTFLVLGLVDDVFGHTTNINYVDSETGYAAIGTLTLSNKDSSNNVTASYDITLYAPEAYKKYLDPTYISVNPHLTLTATTCEGVTTTQDVNMSCLLDILDSSSGSANGNFVRLTNDEVVDGGKYLTQGPYYKSSALGSVRPAYIIDLNDGSVFTYTAGEHIRLRPFEWYSNDGITVPHTTSASITLILTNGGINGVEWPENVHWANDTPPQLSTQATDVIDFITADGGTTWYGSVRVANSNQQTLS